MRRIIFLVVAFFMAMQLPAISAPAGVDTVYTWKPAAEYNLRIAWDAGESDVGMYTVIWCETGLAISDTLNFEYTPENRLIPWFAETVSTWGKIAFTTWDVLPEDRWAVRGEIQLNAAVGDTSFYRFWVYATDSSLSDGLPSEPYTIGLYWPDQPPGKTTGVLVRIIFVNP